MDELWQKAKPSFERGDFSYLQELLGGPEGFDRQVIDWFESGVFDGEASVLAEALSCACFLGRTRLVEFLLDHGVDPAAGDGTGLSGFHWAADRGNLETVGLLIERGAPLEQKNMYDGTVLGCTLWSSIYESRPAHAAIVEALVDAGAEIEPGTAEWWEQQPVPSSETKRRVLIALRSAAP